MRSPGTPSHLRLWLLAALPLLVAAVFIKLEVWLLGAPVAESPLPDGKLTDALKEAVALDKELAKWFIGLAGSVIGGVAVYLKGKEAPAKPSRFFQVALVFALAFAVLSMFFGHLWLSALRSQLGEGVLALHRPELLWPERLQYLCFIVALCSFGLLLVERHVLGQEA